MVSAGEHTFTVADVPGLDSRRLRGPRAGPGLPAAHRALRGAGARRRLRHAGARPRPDLRHRRAGSRTGRVSARRCRVIRRSATSPNGRGRWCSTRSTCPTRANWPTSSATRSPRAAGRCSRCPPSRREGLRPLTFALWDMVSAYRDAQPVVVPRRRSSGRSRWTRAASPSSPTARAASCVRGTRPERWIGQTNFDNDEAVGYLGDRLARLGVEDELLKLGARPGCAVTIGDMTFDWEPQTPAGVDVPMSGPRHRRAAGTDRPGRCRRAQGRPPGARAVSRRGRVSAASRRRSGTAAQRRRQGRHHRADHADRGCSTPAGWPASGRRHRGVG